MDLPVKGLQPIDNPTLVVSRGIDMASAKHTFGAKCRLAPVARKPRDNGMPPVDAQFFYSSLIPIDDPLSTGSTVGGYDSKPSRRQLRPFGRGDNGALDKAWLSLGSDSDRHQHRQAREGHDNAPDVIKDAAEFMAQLVQTLAFKHWEKHRSAPRPHRPPGSTGQVLGTAATAPCCSELLVDVSEGLRNGFCGLARKQIAQLSPDNVLQEVVAAMNGMRMSAEDLTESHRGKTVSPNRPREDFVANAMPRGPLPQPIFDVDKENEHRSHGGPDHHRHPPTDPQSVNGSFPPTSPISTRSPVRASGGDGGISGKPFIRVGSIDEPSPAAPSSLPRTQASWAGTSLAKHQGSDAASDGVKGRFSEPVNLARDTSHGRPSVDIVVGVSRLHKVSLPTLQMKPIYWSPVNDIAVVLRATWFYRWVIPIKPSRLLITVQRHHDARGSRRGQPARSWLSRLATVDRDLG